MIIQYLEHIFHIKFVEVNLKQIFPVLDVREKEKLLFIASNIISLIQKQKNYVHDIVLY